MHKSAPVSRALFPFVLGISVCVFSGQESLTVPLIFFGLLIIISLIVKVTGIEKKLLNRIFSGLIVFSFFFLSGFVITILNKEDQDKDFLARIAQPGDAVVLRITEPLLEKEKTWKGTAEVKYILRGNKKIKATGGVLAYFRKDVRAGRLKYGDVVLVKNKLKIFQPPRNPQEFDLRNYMRWNNVYFNAFLSPGDWLKTGENKSNFFYRSIYSTRLNLMNTYKTYVGGKDEQGLVRALVLGDESEVSKDLIQSYAGTGTLHVLSVSGLHVGLIYLVLGYIFQFTKRRKNGNYIFVSLMLLLLWGYAFLTGMSPSVARSVVMFSFVLVGLGISKNINIYNSIAASAFFLLLLDPFLIARTSFQLSYVALIGIVSLQPWIYSLIYIDEKKKRKRLSLIWFADWVWSVISVSLAAQIATLPLALYYFNTFPVWFILGNLIIIPWSSLVLLAGAFYLFISLPGIFFINYWGGKILFFLINTLNGTVRFLDKLPLAHIEGIFITSIELIILFTVVLFLSSAFIFKRKKQLYAGVFSLFLLLVFHTYQTIELRSKTQFVIHNIPQSVAFSVKQHNKILLVADTAFLHNKYKKDYYFKRYSSSLGVNFSYVMNHEFYEEKNFTSGVFYHSANVMLFNQLPVAVISPKTDWKQLPSIKYSYIMLTENPRINLDYFFKFVKTEAVIFTTDNNLKRIEKWKKSCAAAGVKAIDFRQTQSIII